MQSKNNFNLFDVESALKSFSNGSEKLFYLIPFPDPIIFNPYAFKKLTNGLKARFILNKEGFLDLNSKEFTDIREFQREFIIFKKLSQIPFFKDFPLRKAFHKFHFNVRRNKFEDSKALILQKHFISNDKLSEAFLQIRNLLSEFEKGELFADSGKPSDLDEFCLKNEGILDIFEKNLRDFEFEARLMVSEACESTFEESGFITRNYEQELELISSDYQTYRIDSWRRSTKKSIICSKLIKFVRLIDALIGENYKSLFEGFLLKLFQQFNYGEIAILNNSQDKFIQIQKTPDAKSCPLWKLTWNFDKNLQIFMKPTSEEFLQKCSDLFGNLRQIFKNYSPLVKMKEFQSFRRPIINGLFEFPLEEMIQGSKLNISKDIEKSILNQIQFIVEKEWNDAQNYAEGFKGILEFPQYQVEDFSNDLSLLKETILHIQSQLAILACIEPSSDFKVFRVESPQFQNYISTVQNHCKKMLDEDLANNLFGRITEAERNIDDCTNILNCDSQIPDEIYEFLKFLRDIAAKIDAIDSNIQYCSQFKDLLKMLEIPLGQSGKENEKLINNFQIFLKLTEKRKNKWDDFIAKFKERIEFDNSFIFEEIDEVENRILKDPTILLESNCPALMAERIKQSLDDLSRFQTKAGKYNSYQTELNLKVTDYIKLDETFDKLEIRWKIWNTKFIWNDRLILWKATDLNFLDVNTIIEETSQLSEEIEEFKAKVDPNPIVENLSDDIDLLKSQIPIIILLKNPDLRERHLIHLEEAMNLNFKDADQLNLEFVQCNWTEILNFSEIIQNISEKASKEHKLEAQIVEIEKVWMEIKIEFANIDGNICIIGDCSNIHNLWDDSNVRLGIINSFPYSQPFIERIQEIKGKIDNFDKLLKTCLKCQNDWINLRGIFQSRQIQMPFRNEYKLFKEFDVIWKEIMDLTNSGDKTFQIFTNPEFGLLNKLEEMEKISQKIYKFLDNFLEIKRSEFPKLYFLSNEDILRNLARPNDVREMENIISKCFPNISNLIFDKNDIIGVKSSLGESISFKQKFQMDKKIETTLKNIQEGIAAFLKISLKDRKDMPLSQLLESECIYQILHLTQSLQWTNRVEAVLSIRDENINKLQEMQKIQNDTIELLHTLIIMQRKNQNNVLNRKKYFDLILQLKNQVDILERLINEKISDNENFAWTRNLRYSWNEKFGKIYATILNRKFHYGYEYISPDNDVFSPLSEKAFVGITLSLQFYYGTAISGEKSDTIKQFSKSLGRFYQDFNCSAGFPYKCILRILFGICETGAWICFKNANEFDVNILSQMTQDLSLIRIAKMEKSSTLFLNNREVRNINSEFSVFFTSNSDSSKFPNNLKHLFRPLNFIHEDNDIIIEVFLIAEGFLKLENFGILIKILKSLKNIPIIKAVIKRAGDILRSTISTYQNIQEDSILEALKEFHLISEAEMLEKELNLLNSSDSLQNFNLDVNLKKLIDFSKLYKGIIIYGSTSSGKSKLIQDYFKILESNDAKFKTWNLFPNAFSFGELFGEYNMGTWKEGILACFLREMETNFFQNIKIFDGKINPQLIERLKSLLDDDQKLYLPNGEVIYTDSLKIIFETEDVLNISSQILAKCGIIDLKADPLLDQIQDENNLNMGNIEDNLKSSLKLLISGNKSVLIEGEPGREKFEKIEEILQEICSDNDEYILHSTHFEPKISGKSAQNKIENFLGRVKRNLLSGPVGKKTIIFINNLDFTELEEPLEVLRQILSRKQVLDRDEYFIKYLDNIIFVGGVKSSSIFPKKILQYFEILSSNFNGSTESMHDNISKIYEKDIPKEILDQILKTVYEICDFFKRTFLDHIISQREICNAFEIIAKEIPNKNLNIERYFGWEFDQIFMGKLTSEDEIQMFQSKFQEIITKHFPLSKLDQEYIFTNILRGNCDMEEFSDDNELYKLFTKKINDLPNNPEISNHQIILYKDMMVKMAKISRILKSEKGHCFLTGFGTGRKTQTKLSAQICGIKFECNKNLQEILKLMENENKIVDIIWRIEKLELQDILSFINQKDPSNIHFIFIPTENSIDLFRNQLAKYPSYFHPINFIWFQIWNSEILSNISHRILASEKKFLLLKSPLESIIQLAIYTHKLMLEKAQVFSRDTQRTVHIPPVKFIEINELFKRIFLERNEKISSEKSRIQNALDKLLETSTFVKEMRKEIHELEPQLHQKSNLAEDLLSSLLNEQNSVDIYRKNLMVDEMSAREKATDTQMIAEDAHRDLSLALPALETAVKSLDMLEKKDIQEIRNFSKPPDLVRITMEAVCILMGSKPDWESSKLIISDPHFLKRLYDFDKDAVTDAQLKKLKVYIENQKFAPDTVGKVSTGAKAICMWVRAIDLYSKVFKTVEPKRNRYFVAQTELDSVMTVLMKKQGEVSEQESKISNLQELYEKTLCEKINFEEAIELANSRLRRAAKLLNVLNSEQTRWTAMIQELEENSNNLVGDCFLASTALVYLGPFTKDIREEVLDLLIGKCSELGIPVDPKLKLDKIGDPLQIRFWITESGLSKDNLSVENALIITKGFKIPLIIDPQLLANKWIKEFESKSNLMVINSIECSNFARFGKDIQLSEEKAILIEDLQVNGIFLDGFLDWFSSNSSLLDQKRIYITCREPNPKFPTEIFTRFNVVYFPITRIGLEQQLLVHFERPEVGYQREALMAQNNADRNQLRGFEELILSLLYGYNKGESILDDDDLIKTLTEAKEKSFIISTRLEKSEVTEERLNSAREKYLNGVSRAVAIYLIIDKMTKLDPMYTYSLSAFKKVFLQCVASQGKTDDFEEQMKYLKNEIPAALYANFTRGIFEKHKLLFGFLVSAELLKLSDRISAEEWRFFISIENLKRTPPKFKRHPPNKPSWISKKDWQIIRKLTEIFPVIYKELVALISENALRIRIGEFSTEIFKREGVDIVDKYDKISPFQKLILIRYFRPEMLSQSIQEFIRLDMGPFYTESLTSDLNDIYKEMNNSISLVFIEGEDTYDHLKLILNLAEDQKMSDRLTIISAGLESYEVSILEELESCIKFGDWIFIQNCHMGSQNLLFHIQKIMRDSLVHPEKMCKTFKCFLSTKSSQFFPNLILHEGIKLVKEPPFGIREKLKRILEDIDEDLFDDNIIGTKWKQLVFSLCLIHSKLNFEKEIDRNILGEFTERNREFVLLVLDWLSSNGIIPFDSIEYCLNLFYEKENIGRNIVKASLDLPEIKSLSNALELAKTIPIEEEKGDFSALNSRLNEERADAILMDLALMYPERGEIKLEPIEKLSKSISQSIQSIEM